MPGDEDDRMLRQLLGWPRRGPELEVAAVVELGGEALPTPLGTLVDEAREAGVGHFVGVEAEGAQGDPACRGLVLEDAGKLTP